MNFKQLQLQVVGKMINFMLFIFIQLKKDTQKTSNKILWAQADKRVFTQYIQYLEVGKVVAL